MSKSDPTVSVIVTTKNNQQTLAVCLASIRDQSYKEIELIVVDNSSTDTTKAIATRYTKHVYNKGPERSAQRNFAVDEATGAYVMIIDSDMQLAPDVVSECIAAIDDEHRAVIIPEESYGEGFWAQCKALERSFYVGVDWIEAPRFFDKKLFLQVGGYDENIVGGEDWDLHSRIKPETKVAHITAMIRHDEGKLSLTEIVRSRRYYAKGFTKYFDKPKTQSTNGSAAQAFGVYKLMLSQPAKLFRNPVKGFGVLGMKTVEYGTIAFSLALKGK